MIRVVSSLFRLSLVTSCAAILSFFFFLFLFLVIAVISSLFFQNFCSPLSHSEVLVS